MHRIGSALTVAMVVGLSLATPAMGQTITVQVTSSTVVMETPRGDGFVLGPVAQGTILEILDQRPGWYQVRAPKPGQTSWDRGWIQARFVQPVSGGPARVAAVFARG